MASKRAKAKFKVGDTCKVSIWPVKIVSKDKRVGMWTVRVASKDIPVYGEELRPLTAKERGKMSVERGPLKDFSAREQEWWSLAQEIWDMLRYRHGNREDIAKVAALLAQKIEEVKREGIRKGVAAGLEEAAKRVDVIIKATPGSDFQSHSRPRPRPRGHRKEGGRAMKSICWGLFMGFCFWAVVAALAESWMHFAAFCVAAYFFETIAIELDCAAQRVSGGTAAKEGE